MKEPAEAHRRRRGANRRWSRREVGRLLDLGGVGGSLLPRVATAAESTGARARHQGGSESMPAGAEAYYAYVGARTTRERNARGDGLNVFRVDASTGAWTHIQLVGDLVNPSFLAFDRSQNFLYTVHGDASDITGFAIGRASGKLNLINRRSTEGKNPVHPAIDPTNRFVVVANHLTSTLALLPREDDGPLGPVVDLVKLDGRIGPHRVEQPFAKPHQVEFDPSGRFIVVPDKGLDVVFTYRLDPTARKLVPAATAPAREGSG